MKTKRKAPPRTERIQGRPIKCYDAGPRFADRYTVVYMDEPQEHKPRGTYNALAMGERPFSPQGFCQHADSVCAPHIGRKIAFAELPPDCQKAVLQDFALDAGQADPPPLPDPETGRDLMRDFQ